MKVTIEGYSTVSGTPEAILKLFQEARLFGDVTGDEYIESVKETAQRCFGITLEVTGDTYEERAESLLKEMAKNNMIIIEGGN